ncbi:hypothetical protein NL676_032176 [Syzygium grande]|nr:hypothetical protein NL676_032176 [Syzygium grande]
MWLRSKRGAIGLKMAIVETGEDEVGGRESGLGEGGREEGDGVESGGVHQERVERGLEELWLLCLDGEVCAEENGWDFGVGL